MTVVVTGAVRWPRFASRARDESDINRLETPAFRALEKAVKDWLDAQGISRSGRLEAGCAVGSGRSYAGGPLDTLSLLILNPEVFIPVVSRFLNDPDFERDRAREDRVRALETPVIFRHRPSDLRLSISMPRDRNIPGRVLALLREALARGENPSLAALQHGLLAAPNPKTR